ncbi:hypothetical protein O181_072983 [Austropuccinia psidii MF-1]|uniref:Uncharacterized protein n=1 Tax=Austropuccinia psidii MF-1 TaxID=1389203 RepID=A0A9Q3F423_9BASI|nr:hypothetical protein [Austropuccinia psidii MF-1]
MRPKEAKGGVPLAPKARVAHLSQLLTMDPTPPNLAKNPKDPISDQGPSVAHFQPWSLVTPRGHNLSSNSLFPSTQGEDFPLLHAPCTQGCSSGAFMVFYTIMQQWCIYGIIYHYAPFLLRNPMVKFSGPNFMIPNQGPKIHHQF